MTIISQGKPSPQLPNVVRESLLGIDAGKTAIILDLLFTLGYKPGQWITYREAVNICSEHTAIHIIRDGLKHFTIKKRQLPAAGRGRPTIAYQLPSIDYLKSQLTVQLSSVSDFLDFSDFANLKAYRIALHRELIQRGYEANSNRPAKFSRKYMSERLSVSSDTLRRYEQELGTYVEPTYGETPLHHKFEVILVPETRQHNGKVLLVRQNDRTVGTLPAIRSIAGLYLKKGYEVVLSWRECNKYAPYSPHSEQGRLDRWGISSAASAT